MNTSNPTRHQTRRFWLLTIQMIGTIVCIWWIARSIDATAVIGTFATITWTWFGIAVGMNAISHALNIRRWQILVADSSVHFGALTRWYGFGYFSNNILPSGIGGDAVRAALLAQCVPVTRAASSVLLDRLLGIIGLIGLMATLPFVGVPPQIMARLATFEYNWFWLAITISVGLSLTIGGIWWVRHHALGQRWMTWWGTLRTNLLPYQRLQVVFGTALWLSILSQALLALIYWCILLALGLSIQPGAAVWLVLGVTFALLIPLTINGLGFQEGMFVSILASYGVDAPSALGAALLVRVLQIIFSFVGATIYLMKQPHARHR